jgi:hypothetical protein
LSYKQINLGDSLLADDSSINNLKIKNFVGVNDSEESSFRYVGKE